MSRPIERIIPFLEFINGHIVYVFINIWKLPMNTDVALVYLDKLEGKKEDILDYWTNFPDSRFSQVLVNLGIIPNIPGFWYYMEEDEILEELGIEPREYLLWGQNYDKDMNLLPETIRKPIKDLTTEHIQAILDGGWCKSGKYFECFKNELKLRKM